ncbi:hypothetical protein L0Y46_02905 [bacterium]|nr:hypothetical protein [bacterium]
MAKQDNRSLLDLLQEVTNLPEYMRDDAVKNILAEWRRKSPLVDEVVGGRTTFERAIAALVEENSQLTYLNRKGACNTPQFETMAKETATKFAGILPLVSYRFIPRVGVVEHHLTETVDFGQSVWRTIRFNVGMALVAVLLVWGGISYFAVKELFAYWQWAIVGGIGFGLFLSIGQLLVGYPHYLSDRRALAETTLQRAKFLDAMLKPQKA